MRIDDRSGLDILDFDKGDGLVPVVTQHARTGTALMLAYADHDALAKTLETGEMWYFSRSRGELWHKGATSGARQRVVSLHADCDRDAILARVLPMGPACHTGAGSCFAAGHPAEAPAGPTLPALASVLERRFGERPDASYTTRLLSDHNLRLKKLGEEAMELALACADAERLADRAPSSGGASSGGASSRGASSEGASSEGASSGGASSRGPSSRGTAEDRVADEAADVVYHLLVACRAAGVGLDRVLAALDRRLPAARGTGSS